MNPEQITTLSERYPESKETLEADPWISRIGETEQRNILKKLESMSDEDFERIKDKIAGSFSEDFKEKNWDHTQQNIAIAEMLMDEEPELFQDVGERRLVILAALTHDIGKQKYKEKEPYSFPEDMVTHAYLGAKEIPNMLGPILQEEGLTEDEARNLSYLVSQIVEEHSDIPFIDNLTTPEMLGNIREDQRPFVEYDAGKHEIKLPRPTNKYAYILRAADTLSNYGLFTVDEVKLDLPDELSYEEKLEKRYGGFLKIMGLAKGNTLVEKIENIRDSANQAISYEVYDRTPDIKTDEGKTSRARELAKVSVDRMALLIKFFERDEYWENQFATFESKNAIVSKAALKALEYLEAFMEQYKGTMDASIQETE